MIEKSSCETCVFYKVLDWRKNPIHFNYRTNLSEMKTNVWEGRHESDWSIFPDWLTGYKLCRWYGDSLESDILYGTFMVKFILWRLSNNLIYHVILKTRDNLQTTITIRSP